MAVIYAIVHVEYGCAYVGCTGGKLSKRSREHRCLLRGGKHTAKKLQAAWDTHGEAAFKVQVLQELPHNTTAEVRKAAEQKWISTYEASGKLLNGSNRVNGPDLEVCRKNAALARKVIGNRHSPEANEKRRLAQLGKPKGHGAKISETKRLRKAMPHCKTGEIV